MAPDEYWTRVHANYGSNLGLADDEIPEDYVKPSMALENGDDSVDDDYKDENVDDGDDEDIFLQDEVNSWLTWVGGKGGVLENGDDSVDDDYKDENVDDGDDEDIFLQDEVNS